MPAGSVGEDVQKCLAGGQVVGVGGADAFPGVAAGVVVCRKIQRFQEPGFAVGAVVGEGFAGPSAGDQDAASGVAEVLAAVGFAFAVSGAQAGPGVAGLDAVAEPVRARWGAGLVPQRVDEPVGVVGLAGGAGGVAGRELLGEVFGEVADAPGRVLGSGEDALGVELGPEPGDVQRLVARADGVQGLVEGGQELPGGRVEVAARWARARPAARRPGTGPDQWGATRPGGRWRR